MVSVPPVRFRLNADIKNLPRINMDDTLNLMYKTLQPGDSRKLQNVTDKRKISVYRGKGYMNKITQRLTDPQVTFIRALKNVGTNDEPKMVTKAIVLNRPTPNNSEGIEVYYKEPGNSLAGVFINLFRKDFATEVKHYANLMELRADKDVMGVIESWTGKKLL